MSRVRARESGTSLIEAMVAIAILGVVAMSVATLLTRQRMFAASGARLRDLAVLAKSIQYSIDCEATFGGLTPTLASCPADSTTPGGVGLRLQRRNGSGTSFDLLPNWDPVNQWFRWQLNPQSPVWTVRAQCSFSEKSLVVRAARITPSGFASDPLYSTKLLDWQNRVGLLFGGGSVTVCRTKFTSTVRTRQCPLGWYATGPNIPTFPTPTAGEPNDCKPFAVGTCPALYAAVGFQYDASGNPEVICRPQTFGGVYQESGLPVSPPLGNPAHVCLTNNRYTGACSCPTGFTPFESGGLLTYCLQPPYPAPLNATWESTGCGANRPTAWDPPVVTPNGARTGAKVYSCVPSAAAPVCKLTVFGMVPAVCP